jgi:protein SCO1
MRTLPALPALPALLALLILAGCSRPSFHMTDISGAMPRLDFYLTRSDGTAVSGESYRGKVVALYFGYTHCPDVCPATLANLTDMLGRVKSPDVRVLFVTVDPERDTAAALGDYAKAFSPEVEGLRGTDNQLVDVARRYRVAYSVKKGPPYEVMHSNAVFFFDRDGRARLVTTDTTETAAMAEDVKRLLE